MSSNYSSSRRGPRSSNSGRRRPGSGSPQKKSANFTPSAPAKVGFFSKLLSLIGLGGQKKAPYKKYPTKSDRSEGNTGAGKERAPQKARTSRKPERVEVTSPRLYIGNLSFDATESDLFELFSGIGQVQNVELVANRDTHRSKGFGFIQMTTLEEAKRAVEELHDKEYMSRKLVVSGAKALPETRSDSRSEARAERTSDHHKAATSTEDQCCIVPSEETTSCSLPPSEEIHHEGNCCHHEESEEAKS